MLCLHVPSRACARHVLGCCVQVQSVVGILDSEEAVRILLADAPQHILVGVVDVGCLQQLLKPCVHICNDRGQMVGCSHDRIDTCFCDARVLRIVTPNL